MLAKEMKRCLSFLLAVLMVCSMVPVQAFATELDEHDHGDGETAIVEQVEEESEPPVAPVTEEEPQAQEETEPKVTEPEVTEPEVTEPEATEPEATEPEVTEPEATEPEATKPEATETEATESEAMVQLRTEIAQYIETVGIAADMPDSVLVDLYLNLNYEQQSFARNDVERIRYFGSLLPQEEQVALANERNSKLVERFYNAIMSTRGPIMMAAAAGQYTPVTGITVDVSGATDNSGQQGTVTVKVAGKDGTCGGSGSSKTANVYIKNTTGSDLALSFSWTASGVGTLKIADKTESGTSGTYSGVLAAGAQIAIVVTSQASSATSTFTMNNFSAAEAADAYQTTFDYNTSLGSITINGTALTENVVDLPAEAATLVAAPKSGAKFVAWTDADGKLLTTAATYSYTPTKAGTLKAVFVTTAPVFLVDNSLVVEGLNEALAKGKTVVLMNNATLPAGEYTIPSGYTLQIPYNDANTLCTTAPTLESYSGSGSYTLPTKYRELTMASGAHITVNGAISLSARQLIGGTIAGVPWGPTSFIKMESGSTITVNKSANLYAWGYITGSGSVTIKNGGTVYEDFQVTCWRGGTNVSGMLNNKQRVFPMSQYYIQNVEVPMTLEAGAIENGYMSISVTLLGTQKAAVPFIGPNGMFNVTSGSITKDYNEAKDRLEITVNGSIEMKSLSISMGSVGTVDSSKYDLPVNSNITVRVNGGSNVSITQNLAMLPGTEMYIADNANITLGKGISIYFYDATEWVGKKFAHAGSDVNPLRYAPGKTGANHTADVDAKVYVEGTLDASQGYIYTTASGANITAAEGAKVILKPGTQTTTYQVTQTGSDNKTITYIEVPITPAKLKNADGKNPAYTETAALSYAQYTYTDGVWVAECLHGKYVAIGEAKAATCMVPGVTAGEKCADCEFVKTEQTEIPALGHTHEGKETTAATCTVDGVKTYTCTRNCGEEGAVYTEAIPMLGHDEVSHEAQTVTCENIGWDAYVTCNRCDYSTYVEKAALGHDEITHDAQTPDCENIGWDAYVTCSRCDYTTYVEKAALGHNEIVDTAIAATCTKPGTHAGSHCTRCDYTTGGGVIAPLGHTHEGKETTAPTCTVDGVMTYTCTRNCGEEGAVYTEAIPFLGHTHEGKETTAPTCTVDGVMTYTCTRDCGEEGAVYTEAIPMLGHDEIAHEAKTPDCENIGWDAYVTCSRCDYTTYVEKDALGHDEIAHEAQAATCEGIGWDAYVTCSRCDYTTYVEIPAKGHGKLYEEELIPALCEEDGHEPGTKCLDCGVYLEGGAVLPATGHKLYQYEAKIPTYTRPGWEAYERCSQCAYSTYVEIEKIEPPHVDNYEDFMSNLSLLEEAARQYVQKNPGLDPLNLVIKYIRTGVERYNSGSWNIMAGYEDEGFRKFTDEMEDAYNIKLPQAEWVSMSSLKYIEEFELPNGDTVDFGHMFGTMDITYHNNCGIDHADVGGWSGDLVDLLTTTSGYIGENYSSNLEETVKFIKDNYLFKMVHVDDKFSATDWYGDADAYFIMQKITGGQYEAGDMTALMRSYFTEDLSDFDRADFLIRNRFNGLSTRQELRAAVYNAYTGNKTISTLEATRDFKHSGAELNLLRQAVCYAFADYLSQTAGDYVDVVENSYYKIFDSKSADLAPGITQQMNFATTKDGKQIAYYIATADLRNPDVHVYANYASRDPKKWAMARVLDQANNMQDLYGDPESEQYVENFNVIASINAGGYDMSDGDPGGLLIMHGQMYKPVGSGGFFAITKSGKAILGATSEWNQYKDQVEEAIGGFGTLLVKDGKIAITATSSYYKDRAPRSAVGITATGKVVFMVLDGRQEPFSCGGSMAEIAQIMFEAGCVDAINLDGGGSSTFVARQPGDEELSVMNRPSDGAPRSVSTSLVMASTAPSSTAFDHANLVSAAKFVTKGTSMQITAEGISATGNAAELPEGITWVIDEAFADWASIDENGLFTAKDRNGEVEVKLMVGDKVVGKTIITVVEPDQVYFTKTALSAVYGQTVQLPIKALYQGKEVAIRAEDIAFSMNVAVGTIDGFAFTAQESAVKNVKITAALAADPTIKAELAINLFKQGENSFDFDQATAGDRMLAWLRTVSNSSTDDDVTYTVIDPEKDMVASYVLAMDMSQIPVPAHLEDLIYMLPGADMEDASAWGFLMQLAERISPMTTVTPKITFDSRVDVDISEMKLMTDYFEITGQEFDEATNTLSLKLNWIDQTAAIDPATANPLCMVTGIKVTPKADADWGSKKTLNIVHSGDISYDIYMRASGLYTFAQKPENQQTFGLYDYVNPNDSTDRGGHFMSTYAQFNDSYTLVNVAKEGWVNEAGGFAYYVNGQRLTGVHKIDGLYYGFDEKGINIGQAPYTGLFQMNGKTYYAITGAIKTGWHSVDGAWYYFDANGAGRTGTYSTTMSGIKVTYQMKDGLMVQGFWYNDGVGLQYFEGPRHVKQGWVTANGKQYLFRNYYAYTGICPTYQSHDVAPTWYEFDETGALIGDVADGLYTYGGDLYYVTGGQSKRSGIYLVDGNYYYFNSKGVAARNQTLWISNTNGLLKAGTYRIGSDWKLNMATELVNENGTLYYYEKGLRTANAGLQKFGEDYYYIGSGAIAVTNKSVWVSKTNGYFAAGTFRFGADAKLIMTTEIVDENGVLYYYKDGRRTANAGLVEFEGAYYHIDGSAKPQTNVTIWVSKTNGFFPAGTYTFGEDGKMIIYNGIVNGYYYVDGIKVSAGVIYVDGNYYYAEGGGRLITNKNYWISKTNNLLPAGTYRFDAEGKINMSTELVDENGTLYYYYNGKRTANAGMLKVGDDYYYIGSGAIAVANQTVWVSKTNDYFSAGTFRFGADSKLILTTEIVDENGILYYYKDGRRTANAGLVKFEGAYYHIDGGAKAQRDVTIWVSKPNGFFPVGSYTFGSDGKMIIYNGVENGYYYVEGVKTSAGVVYEDGNYYYAEGGGKLVVGKNYWISKTNGLLDVGTYRFDAEGKIIMTTELVNENGTLYYYKDGKRTANAGMLLINGDYYYIGSGAIAVANQSIWVSKTNDMFPVGTFRFGADSKLILTTEIVDENGILYYYKDGRRTASAGLVKFEDAYYHIDGGAKAQRDVTIWVSKPNGFFPVGSYTFGSDGKMIIYNGVENGYYYVEGIKTAAGLIMEDGNYYYAEGGGKLVVNRSYWISKTNGLLTAGTYRFDAEGKIIMTTELVDENGTLYYYKDGMRTGNAGLLLIDGSYYYIASGAKAVTNQKYWVSKTNGLLPVGSYTFGADGKMIQS